MRADANLARLRPSGAPILNVRRTAPKRLPKFSCASSDSQVRTGGCSPTLLRMFRTGRAETAVCNCFSKPLPLYCYAYLCKNVPVAGLSFPTKCERMNNKGFFTCLCPTISFFLFQTQRRGGAEDLHVPFYKVQILFLQNTEAQRHRGFYRFRLAWWQNFLCASVSPCSQIRSSAAWPTNH